MNSCGGKSKLPPIHPLVGNTQLAKSSIMARKRLRTTGCHSVIQRSRLLPMQSFLALIPTPARTSRLKQKKGECVLLPPFIALSIKHPTTNISLNCVQNPWDNPKHSENSQNVRNVTSSFFLSFWNWSLIHKCWYPKLSWKHGWYFKLKLCLFPWWIPYLPK